MWLCRACAYPWPCAVSRLLLADEYANDRPGLCVHLAGRFHDAVADLYQLNPYEAPELGILYRRFLAWVPGRSG